MLTVIVFEVTKTALHYYTNINLTHSNDNFTHTYTHTFTHIHKYAHPQTPTLADPPPLRMEGEVGGGGGLTTS